MSRVRAWREAHEAEVLTELRDLVAIPNVARDAGDIARAEVALKNWLDRPLASVESWPELRETLYALHLPIKRRLFRESFVAAASTQSAETAVTHPNSHTAPPQPAASLE